MVSDNGAEAGADTRGRQLWRQAPTAYKAGIVMATFGWFLSINFGRKSSRNGVVTSCSYVDIGQFGLAIALIIVACSDRSPTDGLATRYPVESPPACRWPSS